MNQSSLKFGRVSCQKFTIQRKNRRSRWLIRLRRQSWWYWFRRFGIRFGWFLIKWIMKYNI